MKTEVKLEDTKGYRLAISFKPFIDPKCSEHMEIVKDMAKSINSSNEFLKLRVNQFLSALDYSQFSDFQNKCALLLEEELKK